MRLEEHTYILQKRRFQGFISEILRVVSLLREKFTFFNSLGTTKISRSLRLSVYINVVLLINFPEQFELCFYFKYSRSYKVLYGNIPHTRNSIFYFRPKNVSYNTSVSGNEGQCFLYKGCKLIAFHISSQCSNTRQIKCDKTTKIFSHSKVLFHISVPFSLQSNDT